MLVTLLVPAWLGCLTNDSDDVNDKFAKYQTGLQPWWLLLLTCVMWAAWMPCLSGWWGSLPIFTIITRTALCCPPSLSCRWKGDRMIKCQLWCHASWLDQFAIQFDCQVIARHTLIVVFGGPDRLVNLLTYSQWQSQSSGEADKGEIRRTEPHPRLQHPRCSRPLQLHQHVIRRRTRRARSPAGQYPLQIPAHEWGYV